MAIIEAWVKANEEGRSAEPIASIVFSSSFEYLTCARHISHGLPYASVLPTASTTEVIPMLQSKSLEHEQLCHGPGAQIFIVPSLRSLSVIKEGRCSDPFPELL